MALIHQTLCTAKLTLKQSQWSDLFDGGMHQAQLLLCRWPICNGLLSDEAVDTSQEAVDSLYVVCAPHLLARYVSEPGLTTT